VKTSRNLPGKEGRDLIVKTLERFDDSVKNTRSGLKPFLFLFSFQFISLYSIFRTRVRVRVTRSRCHTAGHIR